jgi:hypothetical protein
MLISTDQLIAHAIGDYVFQSDWMATEKTKRSLAAFAHVVTYTIPFLAVTRSIPALAVILTTHFVIDRWRLARYICWIKNFIAPRTGWPSSWETCKATGYGPEKPVWMAVWLMIITDNLMHILINGLALKYL